MKRLSVLAALLALPATPSLAQPYPNRTVSVIELLKRDAKVDTLVIALSRGRGDR
jgi:hypothetical protein